MFSGVALLPGYLIVGSSTVRTQKERIVGTSTRGTMETIEEEEEVLDWSAREVEDCLVEGDNLKKALIKSFEMRRDKCIHPVLQKLANCVDLPTLLQKVCGSMSTLISGKPYNEVNLLLHGAEDFEELIGHLEKAPYLSNSPDITFHKVMAPRIYDSIKNSVVSTVWGDNFLNVGAKMFEIVCGEKKGKLLADVIPDHSSVCDFTIAESSRTFTLEPQYFIKVDSVTTKFKVKFLKSQLWESIYTDSALYSIIGREGCIALDFAYNIGGSEAIAETYFGVMKSQIKDNHDPNTADMRSLVKFCLADPSHCPSAINEIAKIYREGDLKRKVRRHRTNIFIDKKQRASRKYVVSKAIDNFRNKSLGVSYIM